MAVRRLVGANTLATRRFRYLQSDIALAIKYLSKMCTLQQTRGCTCQTPVGKRRPGAHEMVWWGGSMVLDVALSALVPALLTLPPGSRTMALSSHMLWWQTSPMEAWIQPCTTSPDPQADARLDCLA